MKSEINSKDALQIIKRSLYCKNINLYRHALLTADIACHIAGNPSLRFDYAPEQAYIAGILHDIGKLCIPDELLEKKGALAPNEWDVIHRHPVWGYEYVQDTVFLEYGDVILKHHEKDDGTGYPMALDASNIDDNVRLISLSDQVAAFLDDRPYRRRITHFGLVCREIHKITESLFPCDQASVLNEVLKEFSIQWINKSNRAIHQSFATQNPPVGTWMDNDSLHIGGAMMPVQMANA